jgi:hypothetical protein
VPFVVEAGLIACNLNRIRGTAEAVPGQEMFVVMQAHRAGALTFGWHDTLY